MSGRYQYTYEFKKSFIADVSRHPELWDRTSKQHKDLAHCNGVWDDLAARRGITRTDAKKMWKSMVDMYRKIFYKVSKSAEDGSRYLDEKGLKLIKWSYFRELSFLMKIMPQYSGLSNTGDGSQDVTLNSFGDNEEIPEDESNAVEDDAPFEIHPLINCETLDTSGSVATMRGVNRTKVDGRIKSASIHRALKRSKMSGDVECVLLHVLSKINTKLSQSNSHQCSAIRGPAFGDLVNELMENVPVSARSRCMRSVLDVIDSFTNGNEESGSGAV